MQLAPDQARFLLDTIYLPGIKNEQRITKVVIGAIPPDKGEYRPNDVAPSAIGLAWHTVSTEVRFMDAVLTGAFDLSPRPCPASITNSAELSSWYIENTKDRIEQLSKASGEQLAKIIDFRGMIQLPAVMFLGFLLHHSVHHRGQLSMYLRPMGAKVPAIYGESYDSAQARKAAEQTA